MATGSRRRRSVVVLSLCTWRSAHCDAARRPPGRPAHPQDAPAHSRDAAMFIRVKYGSNETLLCNPTCAVINLLTSIRHRAGYTDHKLLLDLSDETGLVKELDLHRYDHASKYLASHATYILVEKQPLHDEDEPPGVAPPQYQYVPLLDDWKELFPEYTLRVAQAERKRPRRHVSKSPSPAGRMGQKAKKQPRAPSRKK